MAASKPQMHGHDFKESYAVNRLLEVSEKRRILEEDWRSAQNREDCRSSQYHFASARKNIERKAMKKHENVQRSVEKQRLSELVRQSIYNEEDLPKLPVKQRGQHAGGDRSASNQQVTRDNLRPFNSDMSFYGPRKLERDRYLSSSLFFHRHQGKQHSSGGLDQTNSFRLVQSRDLNAQDREQHKKEESPNKSVIFFKPNKSETVRELLNQMKHSKSKNHKVVLNSTERHFSPGAEELEVQPNLFRESQLKMISRYNKYAPFKKDQTLLWKKMLDGDNIWLKKFKEGWERRKDLQDGKRPHFKRLTVDSR